MPNESLTLFDGVQLFGFDSINDQRGNFRKLLVWNKPQGKHFQIAESFTSFSNTGTIRGIHLQVGQSASNRIISVVSGNVIDVLVDLRRDSPTFGKTHSLVLGSKGPSTVFVPEMVAHGFQALEPSIMHYLSDEKYAPDFDVAIDPHSIGFDWPIPDFKISLRDRTAISLQEFIAGMTVA